ncbi:MAG TPA: phosphatidate cytidylyltransferase [Burkholderiales bacterium]|nr:phosphatidate cytidylyltransferase [Burkholderiales bacterium]
MLRARILTGLVLVILALGALFLLPDAGWGLVLAVLVAVAAWEWGSLSGLSGRARAAYCAGVGASGAALLALLMPGVAMPAAQATALALYWCAGLFWALLSPAIIAGRVPLGGPGAKAALGLLVLLSTAAAMFQLRLLGAPLLLGFMAVIWISDTAAFFAGRRFGRRKLAPAVSPGKTWEGVAGAALAVCAYGIAWGALGLGRGGGGLAAFLVLLLALAALGILGDLLESLLKRQAGLKDSGRILPGHGGILDRIDALTAALPVAALVALHS